MSFTTEIERDGAMRRGPLRAPAQMLNEQSYDGHASVHDDSVAADLGLAGAPIEGPTHFSQIDPLAVDAWGPAWFERGCVSAHFLTMVVEGEQVRASFEQVSDTLARIGAVKADGTPVLTGTASLGDTDETELDPRRQRAAAGAGELFIVDRLRIGHSEDVPEPVRVNVDDDNGLLYPFTLRQKLDRITERSAWYDGTDNPWGRAILPTEMISVLAHQAAPRLPVRGPAVGLFIDLEVRRNAGPVFVDHPYRVSHTVVGISQSRRVESYWTESTVIDADTGVLTATVVLHQGVFKASYADYPADRL